MDAVALVEALRTALVVLSRPKMAHDDRLREEKKMASKTSFAS